MLPHTPEGPVVEKYQMKQEQIPDWILNEAWLINEALDKGKVTKEQAESGLMEDRELLQMMRKMVQITFFVEYSKDKVNPEDRGAKLFELFEQKFSDSDGRKKTLSDFLSENHYGISLAMSTLDQKTAEVVKYLNDKRIPVVGWVVVDDLEGYWTNPSNVEETVGKTEEIKKWAKEHKLELVALGFDLEKPLNYLKAFAQADVKEIFKEVRAYRKKKKERETQGDPTDQLRALVEKLREEGTGTEAYTMPRYCKGLLGGMDIRNVDRYVEMTYASLMPSLFRSQGRGAALMRNKNAIPALGIASKENETPERDLRREGDKKLPHYLTPEELEADISAVLDQELNFGERTFTLRNLYLYALNDARVALMMDAALQHAFDKKEPGRSHAPL